MSRVTIVVAVLLVIAALVNAAGYLLDLWREETAFDEAVHFFTSFVVTLAGGLALLRVRRLAHSRLQLLFAVVGLGLALGLAWEAFEWLIGIVGSPRDTRVDLLMDAGGAAAAAAVILILKTRSGTTFTRGD